jgi:hypothetical protein
MDTCDRCLKRCRCPGEGIRRLAEEAEVGDVGTVPAFPVQFHQRDLAKASFRFLRQGLCDEVNGNVQQANEEIAQILKKMNDVVTAMLVRLHAMLLGMEPA